MTTQTNTLGSASLMAAVWPAEGRQVWLRNILLVLAGSALMAVSAQIQVPMWPVPVSMQTFATLVLGMAFGGRLAAAAIGLYILEGAMGMPVFAGGQAFLTGAPSMGYIFGFLLGGAAVGFLADLGWGRKVATAALALLIGNALIYLPGLAWLHLAWTHDLQATLAGGLYPFLIGDALKLALAASLLPAAWALVRKVKGGGRA